MHAPSASSGQVARRVAMALALLCSPAKAADLAIALTGRPTVVYDSARDACAPIDVPDINPRAYRDETGQVSLFAMHFVNRALRGPDLDHLRLDCRVALDSRFDPDPAHYDDRSYVAATWTTDGHHVDALIHHEYHAEQHKRCRFTEGLACWYNSLLAYRSDDGGRTFGRTDPLVVASAPFRQDVDQGRHRGFFNPSNIVSDSGAEFVFASTTGWSGQAPGNCLLRTADPSQPASWRAYDGTGFTIRFADPYRSATVPRPCTPIGPFLFPVGAVVRHRASGLWLAVFQATAGGAFPVEGFYYAIGRDLLHWGAPRLLLAGKTPYNDLCKVGSAIIGYPSLLDPASPGRNFDVITDHPVLFFTTMQVADCQTRQRMLVRQPLALTVSGAERR